MARAPEGRRRNARRDRRAQVAVVGLAVVAGLLAAVGGVARDEAADAGGRSREARGTREAPVLPARTLLFGHVGADRRVDMLVAFGWERGAREGRAVLVPPNLVVEVPSLGPQALADVRRLSSTELLQVVAENVLNVEFDGIVLAGDLRLSNLLAPAGTLRVDFPEAVRVDDEAGTVAFRSGPRAVEPAEAMRLLVGRSDDVLRHLVAVGAVLEAWQVALRDDAVAHATAQVDKRVLPITIGAGAQMRTSTLPVERVSSGGEERFRLRADDARDLVERSFPWAVISPEARPRVEILNGVGGVGVTQRVAALVVPAGGEVTLTGNVPGFGVRRTQVVYYREEAAIAARRLADALDTGRVVRAAEAIDVVDVTIVVGEDLARPAS
jgi:hypothetical protein